MIGEPKKIQYLPCAGKRAGGMFQCVPEGGRTGSGWNSVVRLEFSDLRTRSFDVQGQDKMDISAREDRKLALLPFFLSIPSPV